MGDSGNCLKPRGRIDPIASALLRESIVSIGVASTQQKICCYSYNIVAGGQLRC